MEENESHQEEAKEPNPMNITEFIAATRQYLFASIQIEATEVCCEPA